MIFLGIFLMSLLGQCVSNPLIESPSGTFQGAKLTAMNGKSYNAFRGIPYAKPPVGDLRFKNPVPFPPIDGVHDATDFKPYCIQLNVLPSEFDLGQEDCLYLNVFTPVSIDGANKDLKKVFVFIHGGGHMNGFPDLYLPGSFVTEQDVIVVTMSYRLGWLGFLSSESPACEGNFGLKDQILSMLWVKENIKAFGGDPDGITISGESSGGISVSLHTLASGSKDLFLRAFPMSGVTGVQHPILLQNQRPTFFQFARAVNCIEQSQADPEADSEIEKVVECLKQIPALNFTAGLGGLPTIGTVQYGDLFPKKIEELFNDKEYLDSINFFNRDYMVGFDYNEGVVFNIIADYFESQMTEEQRKALPPNFMLYSMISTFITGPFGPVSPEVIGKVAEYYSNNYEVNPLADFTADAIFHIPTHEWASAISKGFTSKESKVCVYRFVYWPEYMAGKHKGFTHGLDLVYLFDVDVDVVNKIMDLQVDASKWNEKDDQLKKKYTAMVGNFMKTGDPGAALIDDLPEGWPAFDPEGEQYLEFGLNPQVKAHFRPERLELWSSQIPKWIEEFPIEPTRKEEL